MTHKQIKKKYWYIPKKLHPILKKIRLQCRIAAAYTQDIIRRSDECLPFPPPRLRFRVHGSVYRSSFTKIGKIVTQDILNLAENAGYSTLRFTRVLDFGCGCGRTLRYFRQHLPDVEICGADIDRESIDWCRENFPAMVFTINKKNPPMNFSDGHFDWIIGNSVFTHLPEDLQDEWLAELQRVARKGALLILSVHGQELGKKLLTPDQYEQLNQKGFYFRILSTGKLKLDNLPEYYQATFHTRQYIESHWRRYFEVADYVPKGIANHQDAVILKRE